MRVLLVTPPMVQFNTPYAATPVLTGFLRSRGVDARQVDLSLQLALALFSRTGLQQVAREVAALSRRKCTDAVQSFKQQAETYINTVEAVVSFLQHGDAATRTHILADSDWLPRGPRFRVLQDLSACGAAPFADDPIARSNYYAGLYMDDLADVIREGVDEWFGLSRYAERLGASIPSFTPLKQALSEKSGMIDQLLDGLVDTLLHEQQPDLVGITIPFPGNLYGAFRVAARIRQKTPAVKIVMGGGYVNTEWRNLTEVRVFDYTDYIIYDDGEDALLQLIGVLENRLPSSALIRTRMLEDGQVKWMDAASVPQLKHTNRASPCYDGLPLEQYCPMIENPNPMNRLWTEQRWMRFQLAHGCYWHRCAFCDTKLDYICRYEPAQADRIVEWIEQVQAETGQNGFHFVDEAASPALLRRLAERLLERGIFIRWWTNVRFERTFDHELCALLARAGCVAVTGGMECAEKRLLLRMNKGVTLQTMAQASHAFSSVGILVHAYLMYGFPTQTRQEVVDALEFVRQLFAVNCVQSAYWHRFALTIHSPIYAEAAAFGLEPFPRNTEGFSENEIGYREATAPSYEKIGSALYAATYNYMHGVGLDLRVTDWFERRMPRPRLSPHAVEKWIS